MVFFLQDANSAVATVVTVQERISADYQLDELSYCRGCQTSCDQGSDSEADSSAPITKILRFNRQELKFQVLR